VPVKFKNRSLQSRVYGVNNDFLHMQDWELMYGSYFTEQQIHANEKIVILGNTVRTEIFGSLNPRGETILINNFPFRVIGSLMGAGQALSGRDFDNILIMPYTTAQTKITGSRIFDQINLATYNADQVDDTVDAVRDHFRRMHSIPYGKPDDFKLETSKDKLKKADEITTILQYLLAFIASISLVVGGIGIMNIMLVSVSERTREIGIRMAIGAKKKDILMQFLIESITLSSAGGFMGITLGILIYFIIVFFVDWPFLFSPASVLISFGFASSIGIFFGYYPAKKASDLKPIDALRSE
jgi:putative ABC transport system permease protein